MVTSGNQRSAKKPAPQGLGEDDPEPIKIGASTPHDFASKNLTSYGGWLPVAALLEKLQFHRLVEETLTGKQVNRKMSMYQFVLGMVLAVYFRFSWLNHPRFLEREPMLTGILKVLRLPPQCTFWRFLASLHQNVAEQWRIEVRGKERASLAFATLDADRVAYVLEPSLWDSDQPDPDPRTFLYNRQL